MKILTPIDTKGFDPEFDHVYLIDGLGLVYDEPTSLSAPDVSHDEIRDVDVSGDWDVLKGHSGQYSYHGAVMHPSEQWGRWALTALAANTEEDGFVAFAVVEVRDEEGNFPEGDVIGWAVAWKVVR